MKELDWIRKGMDLAYRCWRACVPPPTTAPMSSAAPFLMNTTDFDDSESEFEDVIWEWEWETVMRNGKLSRRIYRKQTDKENVSKTVATEKPVGGPSVSLHLLLWFLLVGRRFFATRLPKVVGFACSQQLALSVLDSLIFLVCWLLTWFLLFSSVANLPSHLSRSCTTYLSRMFFFNNHWRGDSSEIPRLSYTSGKLLQIKERNGGDTENTKERSSSPKKQQLMLGTYTKPNLKPKQPKANTLTHQQTIPYVDL